MLFHRCFLLRRKAFAFADAFHGLEGHERFQTFVQKIGHDIVTASDDFGKRAGSLLNQTLGIACPDIGSMGKTRDDDQIAEAFRPGFFENFPGRAGTELRQA